MKVQKRELRKIIIAIISVVFIVFMWVKKDIVSIYSIMPKEQIAPLIATNITVTFIEVAGITA